MAEKPGLAEFRNKVVELELVMTVMMETKSPAAIINIAAYKFVALEDLPRWRRELKSLCEDLGLLGTILVSREGINLFLAGAREPIDLFVSHLRGQPEFRDLIVKESPSETQPFHRLLVKLKKEIIAFGVPGIDPARGVTSPKLSPRELKQWLDEGRPVTLLDTRNDYEVKLGTFEGAVDLQIDHFRQFPEAVERLPEQLREQPVVMFCTGGIRCEKAGPFMQQAGFKNILQLDGGILKYFEDCGGTHWRGECFVFDHRVAVAPNLQETPTEQCYACQAPLTPEDQQSEHYVPGKTCPYCFKTPAQQQQELALKRQEEARLLTTPLPGSVPADNVRPVNVPLRFDGATLIEMLTGLHPHVGRPEWERLCQEGCLLDHHRHPVAAERIVRSGEQYFHLTKQEIEPEVNPAIQFLYEDDWLVIVNKPAPLPVHPSGRFHRNTLTSILNQIYQPQKLRPAHRLDSNTTGVLVLSRSRAIASRVQPQFDRQEVQKLYLARVQGHPIKDSFRSDRAIGTQAVQAGGRLPDEAGLPASTEFLVLKRFENGESLLLVRPLTGRTNQIRLHLWDLGLPICGDPLYRPGRQLGETQTLETDAEPMALHAWKLTFQHPLKKEIVTIIAPPPDWSEGQLPDSASIAVD